MNFFITCLLYFLLKFYVIFGYSFGSALRPVVSNSNSTTAWHSYVPGLRLLLGYRNYHAIHDPSAHVLIELK